MTPPAFYSLKAAGAELSLSEAEIRQEIQRGHLDAARQGRRVLVTRESLDAWIEAKTAEARRERARRCGQEYLRGSFRPAATPPMRSNEGGRGLHALKALATEQADSGQNTRRRSS